MTTLGMRLGQLVESSALIHSLHTSGHYSMDYTLAEKTFGNIYYNDKVVYYNSDFRIIEIRMTMGAKTESSYSGMHAIRMAIYGVKGTVYDSMDDLRRAMVQKKARDYANDPNGSLDRRSKANNIMSHDIEGTEDGFNGKEYSADSSTRKFADKGLNTEQHKQMYNTNDTETEDYINRNFSGIVLPCASASETFSNNYAPNGKVFYLEEPISMNSLVRVSCSCSSYYYTLAPYNYSAGVHLGQAPGEYTRRTNRKGPILNVGKKPGLCKHLMLFTMLLLNGGILNGMGEEDFNSYNKLLNNREEHLVVPKKLPSNSNELKRALRRMDRELKSARAERNWYGDTIDAQASWQRSRRQWNYQQMLKGNTDIRSINQSAGLGAYTKEVTFGSIYDDFYKAAKKKTYNDNYKKQHRGKQGPNKHI